MKATYKAWLLSTIDYSEIGKGRQISLHLALGLLVNALAIDWRAGSAAYFEIVVGFCAIAFGLINQADIICGIARVIERFFKIAVDGGLVVPFGAGKIAGFVADAPHAIGVLVGLDRGELRLVPPGSVENRLAQLVIGGIEG